MIFRNVLVSDKTFGKHSFWSFCPWLFDPFRCCCSPDRKADLSFETDIVLEIPEGWQSVQTLESGIFQVEVLTGPDGETLLEYSRTKTRDVLVRMLLSAGMDKISLLLDNSRSAGFVPFQMLGHMMPYVMLKHDAITFHGVLMEHEGRGVILSAPSGIGKTTHARLWRDHRRALILNGDRATCCLEDGRWVGFSLPWSGSSGEHINRDVPLTAFVVLEQALENSVERLGGLEAFGSVMPNLVYPFWDRELTEKALGFVNDFLEKIPVFRLRCRPDVEAVETLEAALREL